MPYDEKARKEKFTVMLSMRLQKSTDADIIEYLNAKTERGASRQGIIKAAIREYITNHKTDTKGKDE